jgi:hypothetical protein
LKEVLTGVEVVVDATVDAAAASLTAASGGRASSVFSGWSMSTRTS